VSYTLKGRVESRLASALLPFLVACVAALALDAWWPVELAGLMVGVGLALDAVVYHRLLPYQPGWAAVPLGVLELGLTMLLVWLFDVAAPLEPALWFFAGSWLLAQLLGHAGFPLLSLTYGEDGGELGRAGAAMAALAPASLLAVLGVAWTTQPPTVRLEAGTHTGPLVLDSSQKLVGEDGAVVRGGIVIRADDVTVRNVTVVGGEHGITMDEVDGILLDDVRVIGAELDGINVRRSSVTIRDCDVRLAAEFGQGIDISFSMHKEPSVVDKCSVEAPWEGIVSHSSKVRFHQNTVRGTGLRAITVTEMSMGRVDHNRVEGARGVGIFCGDYSHCDIDHNTVVGTVEDVQSHDGTRAGYAIQSHFWAVAELYDNRLMRNAHDLGVFADARVEYE
jgi:nitrous oxidase accessory protein NosD